MQKQDVSHKIKNALKITKHNKAAAPKFAGISCLNLIALVENNNYAQLLTNLIATHSCNIVNSRIIELGPDLAFSALINGKWNNIVKLEKSLAYLTNNHNVHIHTKRNNILSNTEYPACLHYTIHITTIDKPGIFNKLLQFFHQENINIKEANISSHNYSSNLVNIEIKIKIPADIHIISLREKFLTYCDTLNLDASLEPIS